MCHFKQLSLSQDVPEVLQVLLQPAEAHEATVCGLPLNTFEPWAESKPETDLPVA